MGSEYRFVSRWTVALSRARLWDVLTALLDTSEPLVWWPSVQVRDYDGRSMRVRAASAVGYALTFELTDLEMRPPEALTFASVGDLRGRGTVSIADAGPDRCDLVIDWRVATDRPWMRRTRWVMWPVFVAGHHLAMRQGERRFGAWLDEKGWADPRDVL